MRPYNPVLAGEPLLDTPAIDIRQLRKSYGSREVLHGLDLQIAAGGLFGFLGPNGAGKTTTIRVLLGLLRASAGAVRVLGGDAWAAGPRLRAEIGYLAGDVHLYNEMTGKSTLQFLAAARRRDCRAEVARLAQAFDFDLSKRVRDYSRGNKQKLGLIQALMHRPRLLILDEPTIALDPLVRETLFEELRSAQRDGRTVLFSSHTLSEVEVLCDEVAILRDGRLVERARITDLQRRAVRHVEIVLEPERPAPEQYPAGLHLHVRSGHTLRAAWSGDLHELLGWLQAMRVRDVTIAAPELEDLFLDYYRDEPGSSA